jgi:predicted sugar kinase
MVRQRSMRTARAKVVNGKVVTKARFPEGTKLLLVIDEPQPAIEPDEEDAAAIRRARASIRAGRKIPLERLMKLLPT